jgi:hypothetical protein
LNRTRRDKKKQRRKERAGSASAAASDADFERRGFKLPTHRLGDQRRHAAFRIATELTDIVRQCLFLCTVNGTQAGELGCAIAGSLFDGYRACLRLIDSPGEVYAQTILRVMLESFADLRALAKDAGYQRRMVLQAARKRQGVVSGMIEAYAKQENFAGTIATATNELAAVTKIVEELERDGVKPLWVAERLKLGDISPEQGFIYGDLSSHAHADYAAIMARHLGQEKLNLGTPLSDQRFVQVLVLPTFILLDALLLMDKFALVDMPKLLEIRERGVALHNQLRKTL